MPQLECHHFCRAQHVLLSHSSSPLVQLHTMVLSSGSLPTANSGDKLPVIGRLT